MYFRSFLYLSLYSTCLSLYNLYESDVKVVRDYFHFKKVSRVVGLSCGNSENDYRMIKILNDVGIAASVKQLQSITDIPRFLHSNYWNLGVFLDLRCSFTDDDVVNLFYELSAYYMFDHLHQWLIFGKDMNRTVQLLNDTEFSIITDLLITIPEGGNYTFYDVYNHCKACGGLLNITKFGSWNEKDGLKVTLKEDKFSRRWNFYKMNVKIGGLVGGRAKDQVLTEYLQQNDVLVDNWSKFGYSLLVHIAEMFNFTFEMIELTHWHKNETAGPVITGLKNRSFHLGYYPSIITHLRLNYADVIAQVWPSKMCFMFLTVPSSKTDMKIIFKPFSKNVWYMILLLTIIMSTALWMILKFEQDDDNSDYGITILIIIAAFCQQGLPFFSNKNASRIAFFYYTIFGLLVYNYYSAAIVSVRLNGPLNKMNDSVYSLINSKMSMAVYKDFFFEFILNTHTAEVQYFIKRWGSIPKDKRYRSMEDGIKKIMKPGFAFHADTNIAYPLIERTFSNQMICQLTEVHLYRSSESALWSTHHSHFKEITKIGLIRINTSGIRKRQLQRWSSRKPYCDKDQYYESSVTIHETIPVMLLLFSGIILSTLICFIENIVFRNLQIRKEKGKSKQRLKQTRKTNMRGTVQKIIATTKFSKRI